MMKNTALFVCKILSIELCFQTVGTITLVSSVYGPGSPVVPKLCKPEDVHSATHQLESISYIMYVVNTTFSGIGFPLLFQDQNYFNYQRQIHDCKAHLEHSDLIELGLAETFAGARDPRGLAMGWMNWRRRSRGEDISTAAISMQRYVPYIHHLSLAPLMGVYHLACCLQPPYTIQTVPYPCANCSLAGTVQSNIEICAPRAPCMGRSRHRGVICLRPFHFFVDY